MTEIPNIRCIHRIGRRGLSSACVEGMLASAAPFMAVVDGDLQHDLSVLPLMFHTLKRDQLEIVVGSRYVDGGGTGDWARTRVRISSLATRLGSKLLRTPLKDPMSGYFILSRDLLDRTVRRLTGRGFKILLDIFLSSDPGGAVYRDSLHHAITGEGRQQAGCSGCLGIRHAFARQARRALYPDPLYHVCDGRFDRRGGAI